MCHVDKFLFQKYNYTLSFNKVDRFQRPSSVLKENYDTHLFGKGWAKKKKKKSFIRKSPSGHPSLPHWAEVPSCILIILKSDYI